MFSIDQRVVVVIGGVKFPGHVIKVSLTKTHHWYLVKLDSAQEVGVHEHDVSAE